MQFISEMLCELPFMLNLPSGLYHSHADGQPFELEVLQEHVALHLSEGQFAVEAPARLQEVFGEAYRIHYKQPLRTILRHRTQYTVEPHELPVPTDEQLTDELKSAIIGESPLAYANNHEGLAAEANRRLNSMTDEERVPFRGLVAKKLHTRQVPDKDVFLAGVNTLIRLYMQRFNDFFVEEVAVHQLASQTPFRGIYVQISCDGELIHHYGIVERVPPIMRRPWLHHPGESISTFMDELARGSEPDSVGLLGIRARAFLQRGANRSAIIEAAAALDLALARKIREGFDKLGVPTTEVDALLRRTQNQRFDERAKRILKQATGKSAAQFDNSLWQRVSRHRTTHRQGVAHADREPDRVESEQVVNDFLDLASRIYRVIPDIDIQQRAYLKWKAKGGGDGHDISDWLEAEQELLAEQGQ